MRVIVRVTAIAALAAVSSVSDLFAATKYVVNNRDSGTGSLRQAIVDANASCVADPRPVIEFRFPSGTSPVIVPLSPLPAFDCSDTSYAPTLTGETQPGWRPNTSPEGFNAVLPVVIVGSHFFGTSTCGLERRTVYYRVAAPLTVRGVEMRSFNGPWPYPSALCGAVELYGSRIIGNSAGLRLETLNSIVGSPAIADRNVISGNTVGVEASYARLVIANNLIGTDDSGTLPHPNDVGIGLSTVGDVVVTGNVIAGNAKAGISISSLYMPTYYPDGQPPTPIMATLSRNRIGVGATGGALGNAVGVMLGHAGVRIEDSVIAHNGTGIETGVDSTLIVEGGSVESNQLDEIQIQTAGNAWFTLDFGAVPLGSPSAPQRMTARTWIYDSPPASPPPAGFSSTSDCAAASICIEPFLCTVGCTVASPDPSIAGLVTLACELAISFVPGTTGTHEGTIYGCRGDSGGRAGSGAIIRLTGEGVAAPQPDPDPVPISPSGRLPAPTR